MKIDKYNDKCIRITTDYGEVFEGICTHNDKEYMFHEFGVNEEALQFPNLLVYKSQIKKIENLENINGPYGHFSEPYGRLEEIAVEDGIDMIEEVFFGECNEHIYRLLLCLENNKPKETKELITMLESLIKYNEDDAIKEKAKELVKKWK